MGGIKRMTNLRETREVKAELTAEKGGRVLAWHNDREPGLISIAAVGDRAKLTPTEAKALGEWLIRNADAVNTTQYPIGHTSSAVRAAYGSTPSFLR
jgi:hypothetical protein